VELANRMGGRDNITAIVAQYSVPPAPPRSSSKV